VVRLPGGPVTLLPKRAPIGNSAPIRGRSLTVLPLPPSGVEPPVPSGAERLDAWIQPGDRPAIAFADLAEDAAVNLGRTAGVDEVFYWDGRRGRLVACR
jgi:hypothetical protein